MNCPGCGTQIDSDSEYCKKCGGRISGHTVDYTQTHTPASDVYDVDSSEASADSDEMDEFEENALDVFWIRGILALLSMPVIGFIALIYGYDNNRPEFLIFGAVLLILTGPAFYFSLRFFKGPAPNLEEKKRELYLFGKMRRI